MNSRETALDILYRVFYDHGYASLLMRECRLDHSRMAYVSELVYGTIRNRTLLEYQWKEFAGKTRGKTEVLLDMSVYEMFFMNTPSYAIINEANELSSKRDRSFVNAVLRKVSQRGLQESKDLSIQYSMPVWLISLWKAHYGEEKMMEILKSSNLRGKVIGRINPLKADFDSLIEKEHYARIDDLCFMADVTLVRTEDFAKGNVLIQNPSSTLPVKYLDVKEGMKVLDVCASPGTKTQLTAAMMHDIGEIVACDLYENRVALIDQLMNRTGVHICKSEVRDGTVPHNFESETFDRVLCDVPCSGLGDLCHKPEIRWHVKPEDLDEIMKTQKQILLCSSEYLKKGGLLVYSTCTLNRKENENQISAFLKEHEDFELLKEETVFPDDTHDGFYVACMRKR